MKIFIADNLCTTYKLVLSRLNEFLKSNNQAIVKKASEADLIVIGLCAAFEADEQRSFDLVTQTKKLKKPLYFYGCLTNVRPDKFKGEKIFHTWEPEKLAQSIVLKPKISWERIALPTKFRTKKDYRVFNSNKQFVAISTGCSFSCTYCPHKIGAGKFQSRRQTEILNQIKGLIKDDVETIILTGIDTACYGKDIQTTFPDLLAKILKICPRKMIIHIAQYNPEGLAVNLKKMIKCCQNKRIRDLQLPIQSISPRLLKLMNRKYSATIVGDFINTVRKKNKKITFRTDLIVGFPTETQEELADSTNFVANYFQEAAVYGFELKEKTALSSKGFVLFPQKEIKKRIKFVSEKLQSAGVLVHSGGQNITSLIKADQLKEKDEE